MALLSLLPLSQQADMLSPILSQPRGSEERSKTDTIICNTSLISDVLNIVAGAASLIKDFALCEEIMTEKHQVILEMLDRMKNTVSSIENKIIAIETRVKITRKSRLTTHRDIATTPFQPLVHTPYTLPIYTTHTTTTQTQTHIQHSPFSHRIDKAQTQSSYPLTPSPPTPPRAKHIHNSHTPPTPFTLIPSTSAALDTIPEPHIPPTH